MGDASAAVVLWDKRQAVADPFGRASDSLVLNLAEGARLRPGRAKLRALDCALGSCLECAACLDLAWIKASLVFPRDAGRLSRRSGSGGLEGCPAGSDGLACSIAPAGTVGKDQVHAITKVSDEPKGLPIPTVRDLANDKGLD